MLLGAPFTRGPPDFVYPVYPHEKPLGGSRLEKLEEMQRSTVRQKDASETEGEGIQNSDQASNDMGQKRGLQRRDKKNGLR